MTTKDWYPWTETEGSPPEATNGGEPITEPPCKRCRHWKPEVTFRGTPQGQVPDGVRLCHADNMHQDFSCFKRLESNPNAEQES